MVGDSTYWSLSRGVFQEIHHIINARLLLFSQPGGSDRLQQQTFMHFNPGYRWGWPSPTTGHGHAPLTGSISVMFANGLKRRVSPSRYTPPMFSHKRLVAIPHVEHHGKAPGVQHAADKWLYQPGFTGPGCSTDRHVVVGVIHPLKEDIDKRQLVTVRWGASRPAGVRGLSATNGIRVGHIKALCSLNHTGLFQLFKQPFPGHKGRQVRKLRMWLKRGEISSKPFLRKLFRMSCWHCCKVSDEAAFCLIQRPYISKTLLTRRISPRGSP
ncbi:transposase TnpA, Tn21 [Escherichia coli]|nr:transposase TnpA, Tn21 [Escherichia coli]